MLCGMALFAQDELTPEQIAMIKANTPVLQVPAIDAPVIEVPSSFIAEVLSSYEVAGLFTDSQPLTYDVNGNVIPSNSFHYGVSNTQVTYDILGNAIPSNSLGYGVKSGTFKFRVSTDGVKYSDITYTIQESTVVYQVHNLKETFQFMDDTKSIRDIYTKQSDPTYNKHNKKWKLWNEISTQTFAPIAYVKYKVTGYRFKNDC